MLSGAAIGAGTGDLIGLGEGDVTAGADIGESGSWVVTSTLGINISSPLDIPER